MYDNDEIEVALGESHTPSAATISVAESLKNDGNALLTGDIVVCRSLARLGGDRVPDVVRVGGWWWYQSILFRFFQVHYCIQMPNIGHWR